VSASARAVILWTVMGFLFFSLGHLRPRLAGKYETEMHYHARRMELLITGLGLLIYSALLALSVD